MISRMSAGLLVASDAGRAAKEAFASTIAGFTNPKLFVTLPVAIAAHAVSPSPTPIFDCPNREALHNECADAKLFDRMTVVPVNIALHNERVPLTKESLHALRTDINHSKQMSPEDPLHKKVKDYQQQGVNQRVIAASFSEAGEHEGAFMHKMLASAFDLRATVAANVLRFIPEGPGR